LFSGTISKAMILVWPLMAGIGLIMLGNGLQGTLLGLRASFENFPVYVTGIIMTMYYCGFVVGCWTIPRMVSTVGHIRVFAAMASLASTTILLHGLYVDPFIWAVVRAFSGFGFAGLAIVTESWLNNMTANKVRGKVFGVYIFVVYLGLFSGQFLLNLAPLSQMDLFVIVSILVSFSIIPLTLANKPAPGYEEPEKLPLKKVIKHSPLALTGVFGAGICAGAFFGMGAVYANEVGMSTGQVAIYMAVYITGCGVMPLIMGWMSDNMDRRVLIIVMSAIGAAVVLPSYLYSLYYISAFVFGGVTSSLYSLCISYMSDHVKQSQILSATTTLILANAVGSCLGPVVFGVTIEYLGAGSFYMAFFVPYVLISVIGIYRALVGEPVDIASQGEFMNIPARSTPGVMNLAEDS